MGMARSTFYDRPQVSADDTAIAASAPSSGSGASS